MSTALGGIGPCARPADPGAGRARAERPAPRRARFASRLIALLAAVAMLTSCGVSLDSWLEISGAGKGQRRIVLVAPGDSLSSISGGEEALERVIRSSIPAGLAYKGSARTARGTEMTFVMRFDSISQYETRVASLMKAGNVSVPDPVLTFAGSSAPFSTGADITENFTSSDLMQWLPRALVEQGVIDEQGAAQLTATGRTFLVLDGDERPMPERISAQLLKKRGFTRVDVMTDGIGSGSYVRTLMLTLPAADYDEDRAGFDTHLADTAPKGSHLAGPDRQGADVRWTLRLPAADARAVARMTDALLGAPDPGASGDREGERARLDVTGRPGEDGPLSLTETITDTVVCGTACRDGARISSSIAVPGSWGADGEPMSDGRTRLDVPGSGVLEVRHALAARSVRVALDVDPQGPSSADVTVELPREAQALPDDRVSAWLTGDAPGLHPSRQITSTALVYRIHVEGADPAELDARLRALGFARGSGAEDGGPAVLSVAQPSGSPVQTVSMVTLDARAPSRLVEADTSAPVTWEVRTRGGARLDSVVRSSPAGASIEDGTARVGARSSTGAMLEVRAVESHAVPVLAIAAVVLAIIAVLVGAAITIGRRLRAGGGARDLQSDRTRP